MSDAAEPAVEHETAKGRFVLRVGTQEAELTYRRVGSTLIVNHTGVPPELQHQGYADRLAKAALGFAREGGLKVVPQCRFMAVYMRRHPEWKDLLASS